MIDEFGEQILLFDTQTKLHPTLELTEPLEMGDDKKYPESNIGPFDFLYLPSILCFSNFLIDDNQSTSIALPGTQPISLSNYAYDYGYPSSRLRWIKKIFRSSKGSQFASQKKDIAFLLLSSCPVPSELSALLDDENAFRKVLLRSRGMLHLKCRCPHKECMSSVLGWENKKTLNIQRAAELFGPAIAYCIPEKQSIVDFLHAQRLPAVDSSLRVDLQDALFDYLNSYVKSTQLEISADSLIRFETQSCAGEEFVLNGASTLNDLAKRVFVKMSIPVDQAYQYEIFDGRVTISHSSVSSFRCPHQIQTYTKFIQLRFFSGAKLKLMFFKSSSSCRAKLQIISLSVRLAEAYDPYCILN